MIAQVWDLSQAAIERLGTVEDFSTKNKLRRVGLQHQEAYLQKLSITEDDDKRTIPACCRYEGGHDHKKVSLSPVWKVPLRKCVDATAVVLNKHSGEILAFIGSHGGDFLCVEILRGNVQWRANLGATRVEVKAALSSDNTIIFVGCYDGRLLALDASNGETMWHWTTDDSIRCSPVVCHLGSLSESPAVLVGSYARTIDCLTQNNGKLIWRHQTEGQVAASPVYLDGIIYVATTSSSSLSALCERAGQVLWACEALSAPIFANMVISSNRTALLCASVDGMVHAVTTGKSGGGLLWAVQTGSRIWGGLTFDLSSNYQQVIVGGHDMTSSGGMVCCIDFQVGKIIWRLKLQGTKKERT